MRHLKVFFFFPMECLMNLELHNDIYNPSWFKFHLPNLKNKLNEAIYI